MKPERIEPLSDDLAALFERANEEAAGEDPALKEAIWNGVQRAVVLSAPTAAQHAAQHIGNAARPTSTSALSHAARAASRVARLKLAAVAFTVGAATGSGVTYVTVRASSPKTTPAVQIATPLPATAAPLDSSAFAPPLSASSAPALDPVPVPTAKGRSVEAPTPSANVPTDVKQEQAALDVVSAALAHGRADDALAAIADHARRWPNGQLAENREALTIRALMMAQREDEANERAARFRERYPRSVFLPAIETMLHGSEEK